MRILLTGQADAETTTEAVARGNVFCVLTKPCPTATLLATLDAAVREHQRFAR